MFDNLGGGGGLVEQGSLLHVLGLCAFIRKLELPFFWQSAIVL